MHKCTSKAKDHLAGPCCTYRTHNTRYFRFLVRAFMLKLSKLTKKSSPISDNNAKVYLSICLDCNRALSCSCAFRCVFSAHELTHHTVARICVRSHAMESSLFHPERRHDRGKGGRVEHWSLNAQFFLPVMTTSPSGRRRTKRLK